MDTLDTQIPVQEPDEVIRHNNKRLLVLIGILIVVCIGAGTYLVYAFAQSNRTEQKTVATSVESQNASNINYHSIVGTSPIKTIKTSWGGLGKIYNGGTFIRGTYAGKILSVYIEELSPNSNSWGDIAGYGYFISDASGTPVVWDDTYFVQSGLGAFGGGEQLYPLDAATTTSQELGLTAATHKDLTNVLPEELRYNANIQAQDGRGMFTLVNGYTSIGVNPNNSRSIIETIATTTNGFSIDRVSDINPPSNEYIDMLNVLSRTSGSGYYLMPQSYRYFIELPFGGRTAAHIIPSFLKSDQDVPLSTLSNFSPVITWSKGSTTTGEQYHVAEDTIKSSVDGGTDVISKYSPAIPFLEWKKNLVQTGTAPKGDPIYELLSRPVGPSGSHSLFFWQSPYGEWYSYVSNTLESPYGPTD